MTVAVTSVPAGSDPMAKPAHPPGAMGNLSDIGLIVAVVIILAGLSNLFAAYAIGRYLNKRRKRNDDKPDQSP